MTNANQDVAETVRLRSFRGDDIPLLLSWVTTPEFLTQWAGHLYTFPLTDAQVGDFLERARAKDSVCEMFAAVVPPDEMIGYIELNRIDRRNRNAALSRILVGPTERRGRGIGTEMIRRVLAIGFEERGLHRIELDVYDQNLSAIRCYERLGFKKEGLIRELTRVGDGYWNSWRMGMLEEEWRMRERTAEAPEKRDGTT